MSDWRKRRTAALGAALLLIVVLALGFWLSARADPIYKGKRFSAYLSEAGRPFPRPANPRAPVTIEAIHDYNLKQAKAEEATKALGARALPLLRAWWDSDNSLHGKLQNLARKAGSGFGWLLQWQWIAIDRHRVASYALHRHVPEHAVSLLPDLRRRMLQGKPPGSEEAAQLFARILLTVPVEGSYFDQNHDVLERYTADALNRASDTAVEVIAGILRHGRPEDAEQLIRRLWPYRQRPFSSARTVISSLDPEGLIQNMLYLEEGKPTEKPAAALYFKEKPIAPERVVPLLIANLSSPASANLLQNVCDALAAYGTNAAAALPQLSRLIAHSNGRVTQAAARAIEDIKGQ